MSVRITFLTKRLERVSLKIFPRPRETRLPYICFDDNGDALPGYEAHNVEYSQLAKRLRVPANVYFGFDPNDDGVEP